MPAGTCQAGCDALEPTLQPDDKLHRLAIGDAFRQVRSNLSGIEANTHVECPLVQDRDPVYRYLARPRAGQPAFPRITEEDEVGLFDPDEAYWPAALAIRHAIAQVEAEPGANFQLGGKDAIAESRVRRVGEAARRAGIRAEVESRQHVGPAERDTPLHRQSVATDPAVSENAGAHSESGSEPGIAARVYEQAVGGISATRRRGWPDDGGQRHRRDVVTGCVLVPASDEPSSRRSVSIIARIQVGLGSGDEVVAVINERIAAPAVAVPEERPWITRPNGPLGVSADRHLKSKRGSRLDVGETGNGLPLEVVTVVSLEQKSR